MLFFYGKDNDICNYGFQFVGINLVGGNDK